MNIISVNFLCFSWLAFWVKKILRTQINFIWVILIASSCIGDSEDYYRIYSPDKNQCLTFVVVDKLFNPSSLESGIYMFVGEIDKADPLPSSYLKLNYGDWPIGIVWGEKITFMYWDILENNLKNNSEIEVIKKTVSDEFNKIEREYKKESASKKTVYYFDEILKQSD